jgi:hypothetical protein
MALLTRDKYLKGRDKTYAKEWTKELSDNTDKTIKIINAFLADLGVDWDVQVSSGWRPQAINQATTGAALTSNHIKCLAVDIVDLAPFPLMKLILDNLDIAEKHGVYFEDFRATSSWVHCQIIPPKSGKRIYIPNSNPLQSPNKWNGKYETN